MLTLFIFIFGLMAGSFLNVCIYRMPLEQSVAKPARSFCPQCKKQVAWFDNIPLLSWILLGAKCRSCRAGISPLYPFIELLTGLCFVGMYFYYGYTLLYIPYTFMVACFIVATVVDFRHRIIPDEISIGGMCFGLFFSLCIPEMHGFEFGHWLIHIKSLGVSLLGVFIGGGSIYAMGMLGDLIFKKETMGGGDVKLLAMIGAFLGWQAALLSFFIAPFFGLIFGVIEMIRTKDSAIAYGPFLIAGALICLFYQDQLIEWLFFRNQYAF